MTTTKSDDASPDSSMFYIHDDSGLYLWPRVSTSHISFETASAFVFAGAKQATEAAAGTSFLHCRLMTHLIEAVNQPKHTDNWCSY